MRDREEVKGVTIIECPKQNDKMTMRHEMWYDIDEERASKIIDK